MMEAKERAQLLGRANGDSSHVLRIFDEESQAMQPAHNSARMLEESFATGVAILSKYSEQREGLKATALLALKENLTSYVTSEEVKMWAAEILDVPVALAFLVVIYLV